MTDAIDDLISALAALTRSAQASLSAIAKATRLDVSSASLDATRAGLHIFRGVRIPDGRNVELLYMPDEQEWTLIFQHQSGDRIDPSRRWTEDQVVKMSPTKMGYAILFRAPLPTTLTISAKDDRLETISVRRA